MRWLIVDLKLPDICIWLRWMWVSYVVLKENKEKPKENVDKYYFNSTCVLLER